MTQDQAEALALQALAHLAGQDDLLARFLGEAGLDPAHLRARAGDPHLLGAVLDFVLQDDQRVIALAAELGIAPDLPARARAALPGGAVWHWT